MDIDEDSGGKAPEPEVEEGEVVLGPRPVRRRRWIQEEIPAKRPKEAEAARSTEAGTSAGQPTVQMVKVVRGDQDFWGDDSPACKFAFSDDSDEEAACSWVTQIYEATDKETSVDIKWSTVGRRLSSKMTEIQCQLKELRT